MRKIGDWNDRAHGSLVMISLSTVSAGAAASRYYEVEGYYAKDSPESEGAASWFGKGAEDLAARGQSEFADRLDYDHFSDLLQGHTPPTIKDADGNWMPGRTMGRWVDGEQKHRPGMDLTFSPDKSVSIMALVAGDERVVAAHDAAVKATMGFVEERFVETRKAGGDGIERVKGGKMIAGLFRHDTSRLLDPQLHTHAVILNMVLGKDDRFTALSNEAIFTNKMLIGEVYKNELHRNLEKIGYDIERDRKTGAPQIKAVERALVDVFSKRRAEIEAALEQRGNSATARNSALAALATRARKNGSVDRDELRAAWLSEAQKAKFQEADLQKWRDGAGASAAVHLPGVTRDGVEAVYPKNDALAAIDQTVEHLRERAAVYSKEDLVKSALPLSRGAGVNDLYGAISDKIKAGDLHAIKIDGEARLTDSLTLGEERQVFAAFRSGQTDRSAGVELDPRHDQNGWIKMRGAANLKDSLRNSVLSEGQRAGVITALTGSGRFVGIQGYAGTGKTFAMENVVKHAQNSGYQVEGMAPTGKAVVELSKAVSGSGTIAAELHRFQMTGGQVEDKSRTILVVDEASMVSTRDMRDLMTYANTAGYARVVLVGDQQQLDAVGAGAPFKALQKSGMRTALMDDIRRQRDGDLRDSVLHAIKGEVHQAFDKLSDVRTPNEGQTFAQTVAGAWTQLNKQDRDRTGVIVLTNKVRADVNTLVRDQLKSEGQIEAVDRKIEALASLGFSRAEAGDARSYRTGDIVVPASTVTKDGLKAGHLYKVIEIDERANTLTVANAATGEVRPLPLAQASKTGGSIRVFEEETRDIAAGDRVKFTIADKSRNIVTGARGHVEGLSADEAIVRMDDGRNVALPLSGTTVRGMDHAYASTAHDFQGTTVDRIIVGMLSSEALADLKSFYVGISRAKEAATLITDSAEGLADRVHKTTGERPQALDAYIETARDRERERAREEAESEQPADAWNRSQDRQKQDQKTEQKDASDLFQKLRELEAANPYEPTRDGDSPTKIPPHQKIKEGPTR